MNVPHHVTEEISMEELFELDENTQAIIEAIGAAIVAEETEPQLLDVERLLQMMTALRQLKAIAWESWKITYSIYEPYTSMGVISIEAAEFTFENLQALQRVLVNASNVEIYPLLNDNLKMNITFHGITKRMCRHKKQITVALALMASTMRITPTTTKCFPRTNCPGKIFCLR